MCHSRVDRSCLIATISRWCGQRLVEATLVCQYSSYTHTHTFKALMWSAASHMFCGLPCLSILTTPPPPHTLGYPRCHSNTMVSPSLEQQDARWLLNTSTTAIQGSNWGLIKQLHVINLFYCTLNTFVLHCLNLKLGGVIHMGGPEL